MVPVDGVTDTTVGRLATSLVEAGSGGGRKPLLPPLPGLRRLQAPCSPPTVVTVRQALQGSEGWPGMGATLLPPLLRSPPLVTTASAPMQAHTSASAADPSCAAAAPPGLEVSGREQSAEPCAGMRTASAAAVMKPAWSEQTTEYAAMLQTNCRWQCSLQLQNLLYGLGEKQHKVVMQSQCREVLLTRCASDLILDGGLQRRRSPLPIDHRCVLPCQIRHLLHEPCALHLSLQKQHNTRCAYCSEAACCALLSMQTGTGLRCQQDSMLQLAACHQLHLSKQYAAIVTKRCHAARLQH